VVIGPGAPSASLVVEEDVVLLREVEHLRQQIVVMRTRSAVEDNEWWSAD
jgi:hypothetical protein